ncbi:MAG: hypothetical protein EON59_09825 [Alphaproteobacteria bacterium]|nr:MAG: hypothetical protein EON59_09825 [Alphaproteobacteria bacterium]
MTVEVRDSNGDLAASQTIRITVHPPLTASISESVYGCGGRRNPRPHPNVGNAIGSVLWGSTPSALPDWPDFDAGTGVIDVDTSAPNSLSDIVVTAVDQADYYPLATQFDERIQLTLVDGTTARVDALLSEGEYRLDFIRTAIEAEIEKRTPQPSAAQPGRKKPSLAGLVTSPKKR